jgi:hypothetical protein
MKSLMRKHSFTILPVSNSQRSSWGSLLSFISCRKRDGWVLRLFCAVVAFADTENGWYNKSQRGVRKSHYSAGYQEGDKMNGSVCAIIGHSPNHFFDFDEKIQNAQN